MKKVIYLIKQGSSNGKEGLIQVTKNEWIQIIKHNKSLSPEKRRYFIIDCIDEGANLDCMIIEVSREQHLEWNRLHMRNEYHRKKQLVYTVLSYQQSNSFDEIPMIDKIPIDEDYESICVSAIYTEELRQKVSLWKPWGAFIFDTYIEFGSRHSTEIIAKTLGVSQQTARKYKKQFNEYIKKLLNENN